MKVCMIGYNFYDTDPRVRRDAEALAERGDLVDVICLKTGDQAAFSRIGNIRVHRIMERDLAEGRSLVYLWNLILYLARSFWKLSVLYVGERHDVVHVHTPPDFQVFATLVPRLLGARVILDIHDLVPEFYARKYGVTMNHVLVRSLKLAERISAWFANHVITVTSIWQERLFSRSVPGDKCTVILNAADPHIFNRRRGGALRRRTGGADRRSLELIYHGSTTEHFGVETAFRAVARIKEEVPDVRFTVIGWVVGERKERYASLIRELKLEDNIVLTGTTVPVHDIPPLVAAADVGIVPTRAGVHAGEALSTKLMEYVALGIPAVVSATDAATYYFRPDEVAFFEPDDADELARRVLEIHRDPAYARSLVHNSNRFNREQGWHRYKARYLALLDGLARAGHSPSAENKSFAAAVSRG